MAKRQNLDFNRLIPSALKNETLTSLISNLFNRFVSEERSVYINGRVGRQIDDDASIHASNLERKLNALVPALYFKTGTLENVFTFDDFVNRLNVLDVDVNNMRSWMAEQAFNFSPPINYDKFVNYSNYYWIGKQQPYVPSHVWNLEKDPEYYVIALPPGDSTVKLAVRVVSTSNINLYINDRPPETFTIFFTSSTTFTLTSDQGIVAADSTTITNTPGTKTPIKISKGAAYSALPDDALCSFVITAGTNSFSAGDFFTVQIKYFTSEIYISLNSLVLVGKGAISGVITDSTYMIIDGVRLVGGERVLVQGQIDPSENGIYSVRVGDKWVRTADANETSNFPLNTVVFIVRGTLHANHTYILSSRGNSIDPFTLDDPTKGQLYFTFLSATLPYAVNNWQESNYWLHRDDFALITSSSVNLATAIQATRPIIEYANTLQLNSSYDVTGIPNDVNLGMYKQIKTRFNQIPQFDLYRYDGTHHGSTSGLFFYVEDPDYTTDAVLLKRVKTTADYDYVFGTGMQDEQGRLLYYKDNGSLTGIWRPGPSTPQTVSLKFTGGINRGALTIDEIIASADNQDWILTALSPTTFSVVGSRSGNTGIATVGIQFVCDDLKFTISNGINPFAEDETFSFSVAAPVAPRYVKQLPDETIVNYPGGMEGDAADSVIDGTWLTPARMFENLERETREEISFGDLLNHARSVMRHQDGFTGVSFGANNIRQIPFDAGAGGTIREFASNFPLLASMLIERDLSPLTIIDFAEQQYNIALSSIDQYLINEFANYLSAVDAVTTATIDPLDPDILLLESAFENYRGSDVNLKSVFSDTTVNVANWPATLPIIGLLPKVIPAVKFDLELGINVIVHHDGHVSPLATRDAEFDRALVRSVVARSDGTSSPGIFSESLPPLPYARQLWLKPSSFELKQFNVISDTDISPPGVVGGFWYKRSANELREWDAIGEVWVLSAQTIASRWITLDVATIRNSLILAIENKLYTSVHPSQQLNINLMLADGSQYAEIELARFAAKYNYDLFAPDYNPANAFSWNYSQAVIAGMLPVPARWYDIYKKHFDILGQSLPTPRPNIEPWKLLNFASKPVGWDSAYTCTNLGSGNIVSVKAVSIADIPVLIGNPIIDGVNTTNGDRVLLIGQLSPEMNGLYVVGTGGWIRTTDPIVNQLTVIVQEGYAWANSKWSLTTSGVITLGLTALVFEQVRTWNAQMWVDIKTARPSLKLCVNTNTDVLIPPYVSPSKYESTEALLTVIPAGVADSYQFNDNGPIEIVWKKSLEYLYGLTRSYFRLNPLEFLDKTWGETYMRQGTNGRVERNLMTPLPSTKFLMHGEKLNIINEYTPAETQKRIVGGSITWTGAGTVVFEVTHCADNLTVFYVYINNILMGLVNEGSVFSIPTTDGITLTGIKLDDLGIPFELGEKITVSFYDDIVDPNYVAPVIPALELGCEGCVADGSVVLIDPVPMVQVTPTYTHTAAVIKKFKGTGQWFTNLLRYSYIDTDVSIAADAYRAWQLKLAYRVGSLIRQDSLSIDTPQGFLPSTAYNILLKRSAQTESKWISALRIQLVQMGSKKLNSDGLYVPSNDASDWTFRIETYNPQHPSIEYYVLDTAGDYVTFNALNKQRTDLAWKKYTGHVSLNISPMPRTIVGLQNVLDIVYGYVDRLEFLGWKMNSEDTPITDAETGRNLDWQLEVEKLVDRVYGGLSAGSGHVLNPFMEKATLQTPVGLMSRYTESNFADVYSTQAAFDVTGGVIPIEKLTVLRTDEQCITRSTTPIFSAHVFIDEFEHAILMNKHFSEENSSATIFDPFLGVSIDTAYLSFIRQDSSNGKPTFDGFFLSGNGVARNIVSSIDNIGNYYDAAQTFAEDKTAQHSLALLGFSPKTYFDNITINSTTQFNFWRGLIQAKGTNMTIDAFANYKKFNDASVDEYWAYKIAEFGDAREKTFPEVKINTGDVTQKYARLQFYSSDDVDYDAIPLYTQIENLDDTRWYSIDDLGKGMRFEALRISETVIASGVFPQYIRLNNIFHNGDTMGPTIAGPSGATMINASLIKITQAGTYTVSGYTWINPTKLSPIKLFDYQEKTLVDEVSLWHPAIGIHAQLPLEIVNIIDERDPAQYSYTTKTTDNINYRHLKPWADREVGRVWWNTHNLAYIPYYDASIYSNRDIRDHRWGSLAEWASIDLYEWTASDVPPEQYDALASSQEGNSAIDKSVRASGKVGLKKYYSRQRIIKTRPIAWSQAGIGGSGAHPAFGPAEFTKVFASGNLLIPDTGRVVDINLISGRNFGAWKFNKPVGEVVIGTDIVYDIGSSAEIGNPVLIPATITSGVIASLRIEEIDGGVLGRKIGAIRLLKKQNIPNREYAIRMMDSAGDYQEITVEEDWHSDNLEADSEKTFTFHDFGLKLIVKRSSIGIILNDQLVTAITNSANDIFIREAVRFTEIIPLPDYVFINDENDPAYSNTEYEWKTWSVPTQDQLDADLAPPRNEWQPYLGDEVTVAATTAVAAAMKSPDSTLTLRTGIVINRFTSIWTEWANLTPITNEIISNGTTPIEFTLPETVDPNRLSIYANGIQMNPASYVITGELVQIVNILSEGTSVFLLYRAYPPTTTELSFNPDIKDDPSIQVQYKFDYQYTTVDLRDAEGNLSGVKYYFWVQDKTIPQINKSMSLAQAKSILKNGPSTYAIFSRMLPAPSANDSLAGAYDSCAIAGLGALITKNDSYKLRFLRDFTLRDDPEEIKLKNTHTEWTLIRQGQTSKIPHSLWMHLTNAACGEDVGGNLLPAQVRIDYDERNNTNVRFGFDSGQIFAATDLVRTSIVNIILNTQLVIRINDKIYPDYITALDLSQSDEWFANSTSARIVMDTIWNTARAKQINEIFFAVLDDALANNYEFSNLFKTSFITVNSVTAVAAAKQYEQVDSIY